MGWPALPGNIPGDFQNQEPRRNQVKNQVKDINGFVKHTIFEHHYFLNHMGHGLERRKDHKNSQPDEDGIWNVINYFQHISTTFSTPHGGGNREQPKEIPCNPTQDG
jgi:hypothetical protein